jgi:hypothetical protein
MKTVKTLSTAVFCALTMSFSCYHNIGNNPSPHIPCEVKDKQLKKLFESKRGIWKSFYSDTSGKRIDFAPVSSSTQYNPITFQGGRLQESSYLGFVIDTGTTNFNNCGKRLTVETNLSIGSEPSGYLDLNIVYISKDSIVMQTSITGVSFIKYYTIVR